VLIDVSTIYVDALNGSSYGSFDCIIGSLICFLMITITVLEQQSVSIKNTQ
jgi:hypothetical protein